MKAPSAVPNSRRLAAIAVLMIALILVIWWKIGINPHEEKPILPPEVARPLDPPVIVRPDKALLSQMKPALLRAVGLRDEPPRDARIILLREFQDPLSEDEIRLLFHLLLQGPSAEGGPGWHTEYMHEICCLLRRNEVDRPLFASVLAALASDSNRDDTIRDYSLQHLRFLWEAADKELRSRIIASLEIMASEQSSVAPSALLSLHVLGSSADASRRNSAPVRRSTIAPNHPGVPDGAIMPIVARTLATPPQPVSTAARMTAVRIIRERKLKNHLSDLRGMAADDSGEHTVVRMACIAAIAELGSTADIAFLNTLDRRDPRIDSALRNLINIHP